MAGRGLIGLAYGMGPAPEDDSLEKGFPQYPLEQEDAGGSDFGRWLFATREGYGIPHEGDEPVAVDSGPLDGTVSGADFGSRPGQGLIGRFAEISGPGVEAAVTDIPWNGATDLPGNMHFGLPVEPSEDARNYGGQELLADAGTTALSAGARALPGVGAEGFPIGRWLLRGIPGFAISPQVGALIGGVFTPGNAGQEIRDQITGPHAAPGFDVLPDGAANGSTFYPAAPPPIDNGIVESMRGKDGNSSFDGADIAEQARRLGYDRIAKDPPFDSHGKKVFTNGRDFISPDRDEHKGGVWKRMSRRGERMGTFDADLNKIGE